MSVTHVLTDNAGGKFSLTGNVLKVASALAAGVSSITILSTDSNGWTKTTVIPITVVAANAPLAISGAPGAATMGQAFSFTPLVTGGKAPFAFTLLGSLPDGWSFSSSTGQIYTGNPTTPVNLTGLKITVTDSLGASQFITFGLSVVAAGASDLVNTAVPVIFGVPQKGLPLQVSTGTWAGSPTYFLYQWYRNSLANPISGAVFPGYTPVFADIGSTLLAKVTGVKPPYAASASSVASAEVTMPVGAKTASGVGLGSVLAGATVTGSTGVSAYIAIDAAGKITVTAAGDTADLGSGTYDIPLTGSGLASGKLKFTIEANTYDCDTGTALQNAVSAASTASKTTDWKISLTDEFQPATAVTLNSTFNGTITHENYGKGSAEANADYDSISQSAVPVLSGGSVTIKARTYGLPAFLNKLNLNGFRHFAFDGVKFRNAPTSDVYDAKFNEVTQEARWKPTLSGGVVTGVASFNSTGEGYLAHVNVRKAYVMYKVGETVTISAANPAVVTYANPHGLAANQPLQFKTRGTLPAPLTTSATYYVKTVIDAYSFTVSATAGGVAISTLNATQYMTHSVVGPGTGLKCWFDVNADGTIDMSSPLTIENAGSGYDATTVFGNPTIVETTQLSTCQSDISAINTTAYQVAIGLNGAVKSKGIFRNCLFGQGSNGNPNRITMCVDIRNAEEIYIHDNVFENYWGGIGCWFSDQIEVARNFSKGNANDFYKGYTASSLIGTQAVDGMKERIVGNVLVAPIPSKDWSNSHADFVQEATDTDQVKIRDYTILNNRVFWPTSLKAFSSQGLLNSYSGYEHKYCIMGNLFVTSTVNAAQQPNGADKARARFRFNTCVRYVDALYTENAFSLGQGACFEPWANYRGVWSSAITYAVSHIVEYNGLYYQCQFGASSTGGIANLNHVPDEVGSIYWRQIEKMECDASNNIFAAIWADIPKADNTGSVKTLLFQDPDGGVLINRFYRLWASGNKYISNLTNKGTGKSYVEVFLGGEAFFGTWQGTNVGYNQYPDKVRTTNRLEAMADMDAAFATVPGSEADGGGYLAFKGNSAPVTISGTPASTSLGAAYSFIPDVTGAVGTKTFALTAGSLASTGLSLNTATGEISGNSTQAGTINGLAITVTDSTGKTAVLSDLSIPVNSARRLAPAGFALSVPFNIDQTGPRSFVTDYNIDAEKPAYTKTIYVGPGGVDTNSGLTYALRVRSLKQAIVKANALSSTDSTVRILADPGVYKYSDLVSGIQASWGAQPQTVNLVVESAVPGQKVISVNDQAMPAFVATATDASVYVSTYTTQTPAPVVWDNANLDTNSRPKALRRAFPATTDEATIVASINARATQYGQGAFYLDTTNKKLYVKLIANRVPDTNLVTGQSTGASNFYINSTTAVRQLWMSDCEFWGGNNGVRVTGASGIGHRIWMKDCFSGYTGSGHGYFISGGPNILNFVNCRAQETGGDGFTYAGAAGSGQGTTFYEINCTTENCGWGTIDTTDGNANASSSQSFSQGVRVGGVYKTTKDKAIHDFQDAQTWNLGITVGPARITGLGLAVGNFASGLAGTAGTVKVWLDGVVTLANDYQLMAYAGGTVYYAPNCLFGAGGNLSPDGTITTYVP